MKKSRTLKMFSARATMLMFAAIFSAGAWAQTIECIGTNPYKAIIHGDTESDVHMDAFVGSKLNEIECERVFKIGVPATIVLPFPTTGMTVTGGNFYQFACVDYDETKGQWVASMTSVDANNLERNCKQLFLREYLRAFEGRKIWTHLTGPHALFYSPFHSQSVGIIQPRSKNWRWTHRV